MQLIEKHLQGKTAHPNQCEDFLLFNSHFAAVIDGVTAKQKDMAGAGKIAGEILKKTIEEMSAEITMEACIELLTSRLFAYYERQNLTEKARNHSAYRIAASAIIYSHFHRQIWMMGDCQCFINDQYYQTPTKIDTITSQARALYNHLELLSGKTMEDLQKHDTGREFIQPLLQKQSRLQNNPRAGEHAFFIIDGFPAIKSMIQSLPVPPEAEIVLASDGYPRLFRTLSKSEEYLADVIREDPLLISLHPSTKGIQPGNVSFDDRAYLRFIC
jgi:hypothetical protein